MCSNPWEESDSYKVSLLLYEDAVLYRKKNTNYSKCFWREILFFSHLTRITLAFTYWPHVFILGFFCIILHAYSLFDINLCTPPSLYKTVPLQMILGPLKWKFVNFGPLVYEVIFFESVSNRYKNFSLKFSDERVYRYYTIPKKDFSTWRQKRIV